MKYYERKSFEWGEELDGKTLAEATHVINALTDKFGRDTKLVMEYNWDSVDFYIESERAETNAEKEARLLKENKQREKDRKKFEQLQAKYGWKE